MNHDNFFSIDRLIEFGLSAAIAQQMLNSLNRSLQNTPMPGGMTISNAASPQTPVTPPETRYFVILEGQQAGPFSEQEMTRLITEGKLCKTSYVWKPGLADWQRAQEVADVLKLVALTPPPFKGESE